MALAGAGKFAASISIMALFAASSANAQDTAAVEIRAGGVAATNPVLANSDDAGSFGASFEILPRLGWTSATGTVVVDGRLRYEEWFDDINSTLSGDVGLGVTKNVSETFNLFGNASYQSVARSSPDLLIAGIDDQNLVPVTDGTLDLSDPTLGLEDNRRQSVNISGGFQKNLTSVSDLTTTLSSSVNWFDRNGFDYRSTELAIEYQRAVAPNFSILLEGRGAKTDFLEQARGDGTFGTALVGIRTQLSRTGVLSASAGASIAEVDTGLGTTEDDVFFVAGLEFCEDLLQGTSCLGVSRQSRPTTIGGATSVTSASFGWSRSFRPGENLSFNLQYSDAEAALAILDLGNARRTKFFGATANYTYPITDRFGLYISPSALLPLDNAQDRENNYQVMFGLSYTFGR